MESETGEMGASSAGDCSSSASGCEPGPPPGIENSEELKETSLAKCSVGEPGLVESTTTHEQSGDYVPGNDATLCEEAQDFLSISLLIFLYADLRLLSATGRIHTKFETLSIASDEAAKATSSRLAGLPSGLAELRSTSKNECISPAQIMATLLVEVRREVQHQRKRSSRDGEVDIFSTILDPQGRDQVEDGMHALMKGMFKMIGRDLKESVPTLKASDVAVHQEEKKKASFTSSFRKPSFQRQSQSRRTAFKEAAVHHRKRSILYRHIASRRNNRNVEKYENIGAAFFKMGGAEPTGSLRGSLSRQLSEDELLNLMQDAVESRKFGRLDFMAGFFQPGSVCELMIRSKSRLVWMNDWFPLKDCTYAVSINKEKKQVHVVFRGAITRADWGHIRDWDLKGVPNPIDDEFDGKTPTVTLHSGFHRYLFRERKDTGTTKYDEIANIIHMYGREMGKYNVVVTGHSLGGALTTVFGFWASCDDRFTQNGPIKMYTYGGPHVAGKTFVRSFRYQEQAGKLRLARFFNERDGIAHLPISWYGEYQHVGVSIRLPFVRPFYWNCFAKPHKVWYNKDDGALPVFARAVKTNYLWNMPAPWNIRHAHTLAELQTRLLRILEEKEKKGVFRKGSKNVLSGKAFTLEELYIKLALDD